MIAPCFVDTNVLVYRWDSGEAEKQPRAESWLVALWRNQMGRLSLQVIDEFYVTVTRKLRPGMPPARAREEVRQLFAWQPEPTSKELLERAWDLETRFELSFWDALVVAAAQSQACRYLLTEDLQSGQSFDDVEVVDPFTRLPSELGYMPATKERY
jgi:predicted nucleic acid-binding protein